MPPDIGLVLHGSLDYFQDLHQESGPDSPTPLQTYGKKLDSEKKKVNFVIADELFVGRHTDESVAFTQK